MALTDSTLLAELLASVAAESSAAARGLVEQVWAELGSAEARAALAAALERTPSPARRVHLLRTVCAVDADAVAALAAEGDPAAEQVAGEAHYLAHAEAAPPLPHLLTDLPLSPAVVEEALARAGRRDSELPRRLVERMGIAELDYRRASRLARRIAEVPAQVLSTLGFPGLRVALLGTVTTDYLAPLLEATLLEHGVVATVRGGPFGQLEETVLDDASWLVDFQPDVVVVLESSLAVEPATEEWAALADRRAGLCEAISARLSAETVLTTLEALPEHAASPGAPSWIDGYNPALRSAVHGRGYVFDLARLAAELGAPTWFDLRLWALARQSVALNAVPVLADRLAGYLRALVDPPVKLVVTDLDDTLWGGIVAEVGSEGIDLGGNGTGLGYVRLQRLLRECVESGVLLAAVSKNLGDVARLPFAERPEMVLSPDDFVEFEVSLVPKSIMVAQVAERLNLGLRHVLFLDNEPHERAEMRDRCPEVIVPEWPEDGVLGLPALLTRRGLTIRPRTTAVDRGRLEMYRQEAARREAGATFATLDDFLAGLRLTADFQAIGTTTLDRVTQLVQKTNQFNLTTRRRTRRELEEMSARPGAYAYVVDVADRYGPYGLTGVVLALPEEPATLAIDTWLLSCRVMGKTVEYAMFEHLLSHARAHGVDTISGIFRPTERNGAVAGLFADLGFHQIESTGVELRYEFRVSDEPARPNRHVALREVGTGAVRR